eukprot:Gb_03582 [translate_table: standard]
MRVALFILILSLTHAHPAAAYRVTWGAEKRHQKSTAIGEVAPSCKSIECPIYDIIEQGRDFEIRGYNLTLWMSTSHINDISFTEATRTGFLRLFDYIEGENEKKEKVPMTAPVLTDVYPSGGPFCKSSFVVSFYVPKSYQESPPAALETLQLHADRWKRRYAAVRRFGGFVSDYNIGEEAAKLEASLIGSPWSTAIAESQRQQGKGSLMFSVAQYNSPFEYENRVNEIWVLFDLTNSSSFSLHATR